MPICYNIRAEPARLNDFVSKLSGCFFVAKNFLKISKILLDIVPKRDYVINNKRETQGHTSTQRRRTEMNASILNQMKHSKSSTARRMANELLENARDYTSDLNAAHAAGYSDSRVTVAEKLEKDAATHIVEQHTSKRGELVTLVEFKGGNRTQYVGSLDYNFVVWNW